MEGYSVAKVCKSEGIFVSLFKWVSDDGDSQKWEANAANGFNKFKKLFYERFRN
jgi:nucleoside phosphorylase